MVLLGLVTVIIVISTALVDGPHSESSNINCDLSNGWEADHEPEFSHRNHDHSFCDLDIISLNDKFGATKQAFVQQS